MTERTVLPLTAELPFGSTFEHVFTMKLPYLKAFKATHIYFAPPMHAWRIDEIEIDGVSQLSALPEQASLFNSVRWFHTIYPDAKICIVGRFDKPMTGTFTGSLMGQIVARETKRDAFSGVIRFLDLRTGEFLASTSMDTQRIGPVPHGDMASFVGASPARALRVQKFVLDRFASHWSVVDIRVGDRSQLMPGGDEIPGDMFAPGMVDTRISLDSLSAGQEFQLKLRNRSPRLAGERFFGATCYCDVAPEVDMPRGVLL